MAGLREYGRGLRRETEDAIANIDATPAAPAPAPTAPAVREKTVDPEAVKRMQEQRKLDEAEKVRVKGLVKPAAPAGPSAADLEAAKEERERLNREKNARLMGG